MAPPRRAWTLRLLALSLGLGALPLVELGLRLGGVEAGDTWAPPQLVQIVEDGQAVGAFTVRTGAHFVAEALPDGRPGYRTAPAFRMGKGGGYPVGGAMRDVHVAATPAPGVARYVVLGGSAALGLKPVGPRAARGMPTEKLPNGASVLPRHLALSGQLEAALAARGQTAEVVDAGMIAQDSGAVAGIAEEALALSPAGLVLYLGNNEGIGMAWALRDVGVPEIAVVRGVLRNLRLYRVLAGLLVPAPPPPAPSRVQTQGGPRQNTNPQVLARIVQAQWDSAGHPLVREGRPTDDVHAGILRRFEDNLRRVVAAAAARGVGVTLVPTPVHLTYPPFAEGHDPGASPAARAEAARHRQAAEAALAAGDPAGARRAAEAAVDADPGSGSAWFSLARARDAAGDRAGALAAYDEAWARDVSHKRTDRAFNEVAARVCAETGGCRTTSVDAALRARALTDGFAVYDEVLGDHEHLQPAGSAWVAAAIAEGMTGP